MNKKILLKGLNWFFIKDPTLWANAIIPRSLTFACEWCIRATFAVRGEKPSPYRQQRFFFTRSAVAIALMNMRGD